MKAAINIGVDNLKARFGGLLKDEGAQTLVECFRVLNPDTWPEGEAFQGASRENILELAAQCERGFSGQNCIKNSTRSCLGVSTTEDLMRISLEGPSVEEFDPTPAVDRWLTSKRARWPTYKSSWTTDILRV
ncbi:hypothetical protein AAFF_G00211120 [Aldrovandia affinis]|uniref:Uncharacterized protein n=1 Tax=Aldrovandia affinis TaxID=143900 RepID=A0AAD7SWK6_9TELE|nr:hypothetical protein AAFF_G00211120 [Aldrovandia affinis]